MIHEIQSVVINHIFFHSSTIPNTKNMPRRRLGQHPSRHTDSSMSGGTRRISYRLLNFMRNHYDLEELNIR